MVSHQEFVETRDSILSSLATMLWEISALREKEFESSIDYNRTKRIEKSLNEIITNILKY